MWPFVSVLVYSGKYDYVCNYIGGHEWVSKMKWHGQVRTVMYKET